jgi:tight adherence protein C
MAPDLVALIAVFVSVSLMTGMLASAGLRRYAPERKRLRDLVHAQEPECAPATLGLAAEPSALAERICRVLPRSPKRMGEMRQRLVAAGYRSQAAPVIFAACQIVAAILTGIVALALSRELGVALMSMVAGFAVPGVWLSRQIRGRARAIRNGLADVVDLLIVCLESGCSLDQAVLRSADDLGVAYKAISDELALVANEIRAGTPRTEAFRHFAERTRDDEVRAFVGMLIQTDRYGTSIAPALRVHADLLRTRRRQRAEERAGKANVKLVLPLVLCLFPAFYILTLGPAMLQFVRVFQEFTNSR